MSISPAQDCGWPGFGYSLQHKQELFIFLKFTAKVKAQQIHLQILSGFFSFLFFFWRGVAPAVCFLSPSPLFKPRMKWLQGVQNKQISLSRVRLNQNPALLGMLAGEGKPPLRDSLPQQFSRERRGPKTQSSTPRTEDLLPSIPVA